MIAGPSAIQVSLLDGRRLRLEIYADQGLRVQGLFRPFQGVGFGTKGFWWSLRDVGCRDSVLEFMDGGFFF